MRLPAIIGLVLASNLVVGYFGYQEYKGKRDMIEQAENNYERSFNELAYNVDLLHDKIGATLAMNSKSSLTPALAEVWQLSVETKSEIGQLPLAFVPFNKTQEFLTNVGNFSYRTAIRDLEQDPLTKEEYGALKQMYAQAENIQTSLRKIQYDIQENNLHWMDVEQVSKAKDAPNDNVIINGFKEVEESKAFAQNEFSPSFVNGQQAIKGFKHLKGEKITEEGARKIGAAFLGIDGNKKVQVKRSLEDGEEKFYTVIASDPDSSSDIYMNITEKGGHPIFFINSRKVGEQVIGLQEASEKAAKFLKDKKFENMQLDTSMQYDSVGMFTFVPTLNKVKIYPDAVQLKVALDDGSVIGFNAKNYLACHHKRDIPQPKITLAAARKKINPNLKVEEFSQAIIINTFGKETLCYQFIGTIDKDTFEIFINAMTGAEEKVRELQTVEQSYET